jgi:hypothetical protein
MITWTLTLSGNQINIMKCYAPRVYGKAFGYERGESPRHLLPGARTLIREGLLEHREAKDERGYMDFDRTGYFVTARGQFILQMIEQDIDKFLSVEGQLAKKRGRRVA